ncbi:MAG: SPOR domain-containing protein [Bacteroidales bacterium]
MRKSVILIMIISFFALSCGSKKKMTPVPRNPPAARTAPAQPAPPPAAVEPETIAVIEESFAFERKEDETSHDDNRFFVILGSFRVNENANRFKTKLSGEGFDPVILLSETGLNRVSVGSFSREADARQRVLQIRRSWPEYYDSWLLIRR